LTGEYLELFERQKKSPQLRRILQSPKKRGTTKR
jgi:hypothetical protein